MNEDEICVRGTNHVTVKDDVIFIIETKEETIKNRNSFIFLKYNSEDIQTQLTIGYQYRVRVVGWNIPSFGLNKNIISLIEEDGQC